MVRAVGGIDCSAVRAFATMGDVVTPALHAVGRQTLLDDPLVSPISGVATSFYR